MLLQWLYILEVKVLGVDDALLAEAMGFIGRPTSLLWGGISSFSCPSVSAVGLLGAGGRPLTQPLGGSCGWEKKSKLKVGLSNGSLGEGI